MASIDTIGSGGLTSALMDLLVVEAIVPGSQPSYQICKELYENHPHGAKMAESPIRMAQCQQREITITKGPEDRIRDRFLEKWEERGCDAAIFNTAVTARIYGIGSLALVEMGATPAQIDDPSKPLDLKNLNKKTWTFSVFDPLNTAGSLVLNQNPNAFDFQKPVAISVMGKPYSPSRTFSIMNERPIYISYTGSSFGYVGRSVYQRALYPMKSFIQSMITDDMVTKKAGLLVAKMKPAGSTADGFMAKLFGQKRQMLQSGVTGQVLSINAPDEEIESLNLMNVNGAMETSRKNILENEAVAADMPAKLLNSETFVDGFGEGTEDAKQIARYIDRIRVELRPAYAFMDNIIQYDAWTEDFYQTIRADFPEEYKNVPYERAFYDWRNSFKATWPNLLTEPESEKVKVKETKNKTIVAVYEVLEPVMDPANKAVLTGWMQDSINEDKEMFPIPLELDLDALAAYVPPVMDAGEGDKEPGEPEPFAKSA